MSSCLELYSSATGLERLSPAWKAALGGVRCHWILVSCRRSLSCARNHLTDPGPRLGMLANVSSVVCRRSPTVFSPANFAAFRIRTGKRTISTRVSSGRSGPRSFRTGFISPSPFSAHLDQRRKAQTARDRSALSPAGVSLIALRCSSLWLSIQP